MEGILKAGLVKVPVKVKLLIKNERRANYVKTKNIEHIRSLHAETKKNYTHKKNDYFIPFRKQNFKTQRRRANLTRLATVLEAMIFVK